MLAYDACVKRIAMCETYRYMCCPAVMQDYVPQYSLFMLAWAAYVMHIAMCEAHRFVLSCGDTRFCAPLVCLC